MDNKTQSKKQLLEALKKANLPHSYPTLLEYEAILTMLIEKFPNLFFSFFHN